MIPKNVREGAVAQNLSGETQAFTIKANGKAFRTLIDGLYSNKVRAIVRELCSNARDSHIDAGKADKPFLVQIPTNLDPTFRVRDYGTSLPHESVMHLYTTIFESSKESTNEQTGQLGLGSKSPFAYTDSFSVTTYLDGEQRQYLAFLATDGVPSITHVSTDPTDEPNGLEVAFAAKRDDCRQFAKEMQFVSLGYDAGTITVEGVDIKIPDARLKGKGWAIYPRYSFGDTVAGFNFVRQGSAIYPNTVRFPHIGGGWITVVDIPIGTAEVTASRESLSYDNETTRAVAQALTQASEEVTAQIKAVFDGAKTRIDKARLYSQYNGIMDNLKGSTNVSLVASGDVVSVHHGYTGTRRAGDVIEKAQHYGKAQNARHTGGRYTSSIEYTALDNLKLIVNDPGEKMVRRKMRIQKAEAQHSGLVYVYTEADPIQRRLGVAWIKQCFELKSDQIVFADQLTDYPPTPAERAARSSSSAKRALKPGQFWLPRREGTVISNYGTGDRNAKYISGNFARALNASGISVSWSEIFFVTERQELAYKKRGELPDSARLDNAVEQAIKAKIARSPLDEAQTLQILFQKVGEYNKALPVVLEQFFPDVKLTRERANEIMALATHAKIDLQSRPIVAKINQQVSDLIERYPLLFQRSDRKHYEQYVTAVKATTGK